MIMAIIRTAHSTPGPAQSKPEAVRAPGILEPIIGQRRRGLDELSSAVKSAIASQRGVDSTLREQIDSLSPACVAMILLGTYRPRETHELGIKDPEVMAFVARWKWGGESVQLPLPRLDETSGEGDIGKVLDFIKVMAAKSAFFNEVVERIGKLTARNTGLLRRIAADAGEFLSCFLTEQPEAAGSQFSFEEVSFVNKLRISSIQPEGVFADIGCGEDGLICVDVLDRPLLLTDKNALVTGMLASYSSRQGREDVDVRTDDIVSTSYEPGSLGLINMQLVLHYLSERRIARAIGNLAPALAYNGLMHIVEPEAGCCGFDSPGKISVIRRELRRHGLFVAEGLMEERNHPSCRLEKRSIVEIVAARREEDFGRTSATRDPDGSWKLGES